jgi:amino acid transporter
MKGRMEFVFYVSVGTGMALATSVFTMLAEMFAVAPTPWVLAGIVLGGGFCMVIALSIAELASMFPSAPGIRTYLKAALGDGVSLLLVYLYLGCVVLIAGLESFVFALVLGAVVPGLTPLPVVLGLIAFVVVINLGGFELPRGMQIFTAGLCLLIILGSGCYGILHPAAHHAALSFGGWKSAALLPAEVGMAVFLYMGFEWVTPLGFRPRSYERKIPFSLPVSMLALITAFVMFSIGAATQLTPQAIAATPVPQVPYLAALYGPAGVYLALTLSLCAVFATFNAGIMGGARLLFILSREGSLPRWCAATWHRTGAPAGAILLLGALAVGSSLVIVLRRWEIIAALASAALMCVIYASFMLATVRLRRLRPQARRPYRTPVASWWQWGLVVLLPLMGAQSLVSEPTRRFAPALGTLATLAAAFALTRWSLGRSRRLAAATSQERPGAAAAPGAPASRSTTPDADRTAERAPAAGSGALPGWEA